MDDRRPFQLRLEPRVREALEAEAVRQGISMNDTIQMILASEFGIAYEPRTQGWRRRETAP